MTVSDYSVLALHVNKKCNLRCPHCLWYARDKEFFNNEELTVDQAKQIIRYFHKNEGIRTIRIQSDGEVLLYPGYKELVNFTYSLGCNRQMLVTNGILIDKYRDFILNKLNVLVSLDGQNFEEYEKIRGGTEKTYH